MTYFNRVIRADIQILKLEKWLKRKNIVLVKSRSLSIVDETDLDRKLVFLSIRQKPIHQLYSLLHESRVIS